MHGLLAVDLPYWAETAIKVGVILAIIPAGALILGYVFLMKMMSHMQSRLGPMEAGPHGSLQLVADGVKFMQKEDIIPTMADKRVFALAPLVVILSTFLLYVVVPVGPRLVVENLDVGIFFALGVSSLSVIGVLVASQAELTQTPFDMPVAESELVAGYMTEYTGFRFLFFFMGEFGTAFALSAIAATLFLGGWYVPGVHGTAADVVGPAVVFGKIMLVAFFIFWFRFTFPRFREDQLQAIAWKYLVPLSLVNILA